MLGIGQFEQNLIIDLVKVYKAKLVWEIKVWKIYLRPLHPVTYVLSFVLLVQDR